MKEINLELYRTFVTAAKSGSFSAAAEKLNISQPAVSQAIRQLEGLLDLPLFIRKGKAGRLTEAGQLLFDKIAPSLDQIDQAEKRLIQLQQKAAGKIRLSCGYQAWKRFLAPSLKGFLTRYPDIQIEFRESSSVKSLKSLKQGESDAALLMLPALPRNISVEHTILKRVEIGFYASPAFMDPEDREMSLQEIQNAPFLLPHARTSTRNMLDKIFSQQGIRPRTEVEAGSMALLIDLVKQGLGIAPIASDYVREEESSGELHRLKIRNIRPELTLALAGSSANQNPAAVKAFMDYFVPRIKSN